MSAVFLKLLNMSISAGWVVLILILFRLIFKKAPKWITALMWALVGIRLVCPFSFESVLSLMPNPETVPSEIIYAKEPAIESGIGFLDGSINPVISEAFAPSPMTSANPLQILLIVAANLWVLGIIALLLYAAISVFVIHRKVREAALVKENVYICDRIATPFIFGVIRPKIYLPSDINEQDYGYVIAHEKAHLKRKDHLWKPLAFLLLVVYWFNPLVWVAYILLCRDIEFACDEKVIKQLGEETKKPYSTALVNCSAPRRMITACPLAFGEVGVKGRIKSVLNYKKPAFWVIIAAVLACALVSVSLLTNPVSSNPSSDNNSSNSSDTSSGTVMHTADTAVAFANWNGDFLPCLNADKFHISSVMHLPILKFESLNELEQFKSDYKDKFAMEASYDEVPSFKEVTSDMDDSFFEENTLLLVYVGANNCTHRFALDQIYEDDKSILLQIEETTKAETVDTAMSGWFVLVTLKKEKAQKYTEFDAVLKQEPEPTPDENTQSYPEFQEVEGGRYSDIEGVTISLCEINLATETPCIIVDFMNESENEFVCGMSFDIKYLENGEFKSTAKPDLYFTSLAWALDSGGVCEHKYNIEDFDLSKEGTYRFEIKVGEQLLYFTFETK